MDFHIIRSLLAQVVGPSGSGAGDMVGQAYIVLNTASLIGAAFWLGAQWKTIKVSSKEIDDLKDKIGRHVTPIAEMKVTIDNIKEDVEQLTESMERLQRSIFMEAINMGRRNQDDVQVRQKSGGSGHGSGHGSGS